MSPYLKDTSTEMDKQKQTPTLLFRLSKHSIHVVDSIQGKLKNQKLDLKVASFKKLNKKMPAVTPQCQPLVGDNCMLMFVYAVRYES